MTCPPNAFRTGEAVIRLEPGGSFTSTWGLTPALRSDRTHPACCGGAAAGRRARSCSSSPPRAAGAILSRLHRRIVLPTVVLEIVLGILIGPEGLGLAEVDSHIDFLANLGLVFLFFFAGLELVEQRVARRSLVRGTIGWAISLPIGVVVGLALHQAGLDAEAWLLGVALSTTALGTLVPILADARLLADAARLGGAGRRRRG